MKNLTFDHVLIELKSTAWCYRNIDPHLGPIDNKAMIRCAEEFEAAIAILENLSKLKTFTRPQYGVIGSRDVDVAKQIEIWESIFGHDTCDLCKGESGAVPGNGNIINGQVVCDYCSVKMSKEP